MSVKLMVAVFDDVDLTPSETLVGLALADCANDDGECYPGQRKLTQKTRLSVRTVRDALASLEFKQRIRRRRRYRDKGERAGYRTSDEYHLFFGLPAFPAAKFFSETLPAKSADLTGNHCRAIKRKGKRKVVTREEVIEGWERDLEALGCKRTS